MLDLGKAVAAVSANGGLSVSRYIRELDKNPQALSNRSVPCVMVPTCPSGAELRTAAHAIVESSVALPLVPHPSSTMFTLVDHVLSHSLPPALTASTAIATLLHALETYISPDATDDSRRLSAAALVRSAGALTIHRACKLETVVVLCVRWVEQCFPATPLLAICFTADGKGDKGRQSLAEASLCASAVLNSVPAGVVRGLGVAIGGRYDLKYSSVLAAVARPAMADLVRCELYVWLVFGSSVCHSG